MLGRKKKHKLLTLNMHLLCVSVSECSCFNQMHLNVFFSLWLLTPLQEKVIIGVAYDCVEKMVYWTEITSPSISKANIHGGEPVFVITSGMLTPHYSCSFLSSQLLS